MKNICQNGWYEIQSSAELRDGLFGPGDIIPTDSCTTHECYHNTNDIHIEL